MNRLMTHEEFKTWLWESWEESLRDARLAGVTDEEWACLEDAPGPWAIESGNDD